MERQLLLTTDSLRRSGLAGPLEDDTVEVKLQVTNNGRLAQYFLKILEDCSFDQPEKQARAFLINKIGPGSVTAFSYTAVAYRRGHYKSASTTLQSSDPLGLIMRRRIWRLPLNLTVYPTYYPIPGLLAAETSWSDRGIATKSLAGAEFYGSREYQYGDPLQRVHWRNTARTGHFMLKEFEESSQGSVTVAFATSPNWGTGRETTLEYSIKIAASLAKFCADSGQRINIIAGERRQHNAGWLEAMDFLAHLEAGGKGTLAELTSMAAPGQLVVAIVSPSATELIPIMEQLASRIQTMVAILLEGFAPNEPDNEFRRQAKGSNLNVISCTRGNLGEVIAKLGRPSSLTGRLAASVGKITDVRS